MRCSTRPRCRRGATAGGGHVGGERGDVLERGAHSAGRAPWPETATARWWPSRGAALTPGDSAAAVEDLREHLSDDEIYDAIAVVGLLNLANRVALATGISTADDLYRPPSMDVTHGMADIEPGLRLHYVAAGKGERTIVLIHGFPQTWWEWRHTIPALVAAGYRVEAPDYRGAGHSWRPQGGYDKRTMAGDIRALVRRRLGHRTTGSGDRPRHRADGRVRLRAGLP